MSKATGRRYERKAQRILEAAGYSVTVAAASLGCFDLVAVGPRDVRLVQVKGGLRPWLSPAERVAIQLLPVPSCCCSKELWKFQKYGREPQIEIIQ